jgi:hypothetical protein
MLLRRSQRPPDSIASTLDDLHPLCYSPSDVRMRPRDGLNNGRHLRLREAGNSQIPQVG